MSGPGQSAPSARQTEALVQAAKAAAPAPLVASLPANPARAPAAEADSPSLQCRQAIVGTQTVFLCVEDANPLAPYLAAVPGVLIAALGFYVVHRLSVRRQRRDEQFKMVQATRELVTAVTDEAGEAWMSKRGRGEKAQLLIQRVGRIGRAAQMLRLRDARFDVGVQVTTFRQAVTNDVESGTVSSSRRAEIMVAGADLDEAIYRAFIGIYG